MQHAAVVMCVERVNALPRPIGILDDAHIGRNSEDRRIILAQIVVLSVENDGEVCMNVELLMHSRKAFDAGNRLTLPSRSCVPTIPVMHTVVSVVV